MRMPFGSQHNKLYCSSRSFKPATEDRLLPDPLQQLKDPPPALSTYTAAFFTTGNAVHVPCDPHLDKDSVRLITFFIFIVPILTLRNPGEALYRFLLTHSSSPPTHHLYISDTRNETRTRIVGSHHPYGGQQPPQ